MTKVTSNLEEQSKTAYDCQVGFRTNSYKKRSLALKSDKH